MQTSEPVACKSGLAWARRPRRLTPLSWPSPQGLLERAPARCAWRRARHGNGLTRRFAAGGSTVRRELLLHGGYCVFAGVDAGCDPEKDPRLQFFAQVQHVVQCGYELQDRGRRDGPAVLRRDVVSALLRQDGVCLDRLHDQHVQRATVHAEGDRECRRFLCVSPQLGLLHVAV